ncbi:Unknown protein sequence [Pseudomonas syringae pv. castaneae]|uniref:Uncharacterized protein n=1 Tax=Pseudomonas syringae pv. castaneae TaxID=264450 RepID=A0A0P9PJP4_PSESX|nr:Unknown protein sequence [Pseudomonas syringae pv. castaneae]
MLDVLPRGPAQVEADHVAVGLHSGSDGVEQGVFVGGEGGVTVFEMMRKKLPGHAV